MKQIEENVSNPHLSPLTTADMRLAMRECMAGQGSGLNRGKLLAPSQIKTRHPEEDYHGEIERLVYIVS